MLAERTVSCSVLQAAALAGWLTVFCRCGCDVADQVDAGSADAHLVSPV